MRDNSMIIVMDSDLLDLHTECVKNNEWPGAENTIEADGNTRIMKPAVPYWLGMKYFEEF